MKTNAIILSGSILLALWFLLSSGNIKSNSGASRTEEYAQLDVVHAGKIKRIHLAKANQPLSESEWKEEKVEHSNDYNPIITALNQLNEQGFEIVNFSSSYAPNSVDIRQTYLLVKKIK